MKVITPFTSFADSSTVTPIKISTGADSGLPSASANNATLQSALSTVYVLAGIVCVLVIIIGGIRYATSNGDSSGIQSGKNTILYGLVGIVIVLMAAAITQLVLARIH